MITKYDSGNSKYYWEQRGISQNIRGKKLFTQEFYRINYPIGGYIYDTPNNVTISKPSPSDKSDYTVNILPNAGTYNDTANRWELPGFQIILTTDVQDNYSTGTIRLFLDINTVEYFWLFSPQNNKGWHFNFEPQQGVKWLAKPIANFVTQNTGLSPQVTIFIEQGFKLLSGYFPKKIQISINIACYQDPSNPPVVDSSFMRLSVTGFIVYSVLSIRPVPINGMRLQSHTIQYGA